MTKNSNYTLANGPGNIRNLELIYGLVWIYDPEKDSFKASFDQGPQKNVKSIGFTVSVRKSIKKALVLQCRSEKVANKYWFYKSGNRNWKKSIVFIDRATEIVLKKHWFYIDLATEIVKSIGFINRATEIVKKQWFYR